jgi:hypothetical protein
MRITVCSAIVAEKKILIRHVANIVTCEWVRIISQEQYFEVLICGDWLHHSEKTYFMVSVSDASFGVKSCSVRQVKKQRIRNKGAAQQ